MKRLRAWMMRVAGIFTAGPRREFAEELESHLQLHIEDNLRCGMTPEQARREAIIKLGGVESTRQSYSEQGTVPFVESFLQDVRFAIRQLIRNPGFTVVAILMLSLGMAASVAIFSFVEATLIKPLPYYQPNRLVDVNESITIFPRSNLSYLDYLDWKRMNQVFSSLEMFGGRGFLLTTPAGSEPVSGSRVSAGFFSTLGVAPILGRDFYVGEDQPGAPGSVMLSYGAWQKRFGGRRDVIGQTITLSGVPNTIIGVLPQDFHFALRGDAEFWQSFHAGDECSLRRSCHNLYGVARLKDGVSVETARANMKAIAEQLERQYPDSNRGQGASVQPLYEAIVGDIRPILLVLLAGAGLLLLIGCVNVSSLLLVRFENRKREIAVRGALGASNARLIRQFITEALVLVTTGSLLGMALAYGAMQILLRLISKDMLFSMPYLRGLGMNLHVVTFAGVMALLAAFLFSITPILRLPTTQIREGLVDGGRGTSGIFWRRFGSNLVVVELAIAMVLLVGAGLLGKSFYRLLHVELGFEPDRLATLGVNLPGLRYDTAEQKVAVGREVVNRVRSLPGVTSVGIANILAVSGNGNTDWIRFVGKPYNGEHNEVNQRDVSADYLKTLQATLISGRYFTDDEDATRPNVVIINKALAQKYFPAEDPIGKKIGDTDLSPKSIREIIGVVDDVREASLDSSIMPTVYYPFNQSPDMGFGLVARTSQPEQWLLPSIAAAIHQVDPGIGTIGESTMNRRISESQTAYLHRSSAWLVGGFAGLALLLGVIGLYGVIAYSVSQRTREIGVRMALGAQRSSVYQLILSEAGRLTVLGIVAGIVCSILAATLMRKLLFGVRSWDIATLAAVVVVLGVSALFASYIPARRAASVNPVEALRSE
jgi:macrolide transport system ATP-binding/permease protein